MTKFFTFVPGSSCNNNCVFCTRPNDPAIPNTWGFEPDRGKEEVFRELEAVRRDFAGLILTGGEPSTRADFFDILEKCSELEFEHVMIQTNGRMFADKTFCKKTIATLNGKVSFFFSFHSQNRETMEMLAGKKGVFDETVQGLKNLLAEGVPLRTATAVMKPNFKELKNLLEFLQGLGVKNSELVFVHPNGMAWVNRSRIVPRIEETIPFVKRALDFGRGVGMTVTTQKFPFCVLGGYKEFAAEFFMPAGMIAGNSKVQFKARPCEQCDYYNNCPGIWANYLKVFDFKFKPFKQKS